MIIKLLAIKDEAGNVDKERAFAVSKDGRYERVVSIDKRLESELAAGHKYFNAIQKGDKLNITGTVVANF